MLSVKWWKICPGLNVLILPIVWMMCDNKGFSVLFAMVHFHFPLAAAAAHDGSICGNTSWDNDIPDACDSWLTTIWLFDVLGVCCHTDYKSKLHVKFQFDSGS